MVLCRCYQTQVTSPSNSHLLPATIPCTGSPPSYTGSMPYGECQTVPQSGLNYPSYMGYTSGFDGYGVYQSIYPHLSPVSKGKCLAPSFFLPLKIQCLMINSSFTIHVWVCFKNNSLSLYRRFFRFDC